MKRVICIMVIILTVAAATAGCARTLAAAPTGTESLSTSEPSISLTSPSANTYINSIYCSGRTVAPISSCGIYIPEDIPMAYFEISAVGKKTGSTVETDLLDGVDVAAGEWIVISDLQEYTEANLVMRIVCEGTTLASREVDLMQEIPAVNG